MTKVPSEEDLQTIVYLSCPTFVYLQIAYSEELTHISYKACCNLTELILFLIVKKFHGQNVFNAFVHHYERLELCRKICTAFSAS
ncbi:hypothetical protein KIN20_016134 [Parelaphostrongylus tenuis]|uniref:Uncharacterized protein n=1 Tax=Parelaphostrongylus tenuis TaxID=148309 RepID=A0AAD5MZF2_PARTN|nr:hypothetical protein KIN20_016134 [Parelaphostrongylus tenuis]